MPNSKKVSKKSLLAENWIHDIQSKLFTTPNKLMNTDVLENIETHIRQCSLQLNGFISRSMIFVIDHSTLDYLYISDSAQEVLGYSKETMMQNGFHWLFTLFSAAELKYKQVVMEDIYACLKKLPVDQVFKTCSRYNVEVLHKDGSKRMLVEEMMYPKVESSGLPVITTAFVHDVTDLFHDTARKCQIELMDGNTRKVIFEKHYTQFEANNPLSEREIEILSSIANGSTTSNLAKVFNLSPHTVNAHRKNIIRKLAAKNAIDAVQIALKNRYIRM
ncbi:LuxR C-terminal-related transcriptional regulator [Phnomibacter sp. MR]|uniref:LuxR C-terminal-related transcriptional regulator n=1 Tax=Phnomibacter sp. MR TaxID=3042318 RepID=UPI003A801601